METRDPASLLPSPSYLIRRMIWSQPAKPRMALRSNTWTADPSRTSPDRFSLLVSSQYSIDVESLDQSPPKICELAKVFTKSPYTWEAPEQSCLQISPHYFNFKDCILSSIVNSSRKIRKNETETETTWSKRVWIDRSPVKIENGSRRVAVDVRSIPKTYESPEVCFHKFASLETLFSVQAMRMSGKGQHLILVVDPRFPDIAAGK